MILKYQLKKFSKRSRLENPDSNSLKILQDEYLKYLYTSILNKFEELGTYGSFIHKTELRILEIGSSGGITKDMNPEVITSDIRQSWNIDLVLDACRDFPFEDESLCRIQGKDVLHHLPDIENHFREVYRCLKPGGHAIYAEPNWNLISRIVFSLFHPEPYLLHQKAWAFVSDNPMFSNQALPYILFVRDFSKFKEKFPGLVVEIIEPPLNAFSFILSGGVYTRSKISSKFLIWLDKLENKSVIWMRFFGLTRIVRISKIAIPTH